MADVKEHADETLQSLQFAARAMCVKNKPVVNERLNYKVGVNVVSGSLQTTSGHAVCFQNTKFNLVCLFVSHV